MGADTGEINRTAGTVCVVNAIDQQKVAAHMAFPMVRPCAFQRMIFPFGTERGIVCNEKQHDRLQPLHVVPAGTRKSLPVLEEFPGVVNPARQVASFTGCRLLQVP